MKTLYKPLISVVVAVICLGLAGCGSHKKAVGPSTAPEIRKERVLSDDFRRLAGSYTPWSNVSMPVKVRLTAPKRVSLSGSLNMEYDKALELNLRMLFMDALTVYADNVSLIVLSKPLDIYYMTSMESFTDETGLDLRDLQSLLLGQMFRPGSGTVTPSALESFNLSSDLSNAGDIVSMDVRQRNGMAGVGWFFRTIVSSTDNEAIPHLSLLDINVSSVHVQCAFSDYFTSEAGEVAGNIDISGKMKAHEITASLISDPARAKWNRGTGIREPKIPEGMRRMTTEQIFRILKK